jgi:hypothetical protein
VRPTLSLANATVNESAGSVTLTATLSGAASSAVTVDYATQDGTATSAGDYTAATGTLTFPAGTTSQTFSVPLTDDSAIEATENFKVNLTNLSGALPGTLSATVTIQDDDDTAGVCGQPAYATGSPPPGIFLWRDCAYTGSGQRWYLRTTGGGSATTLKYEGHLTSADSLAAAAFSVEAVDTFTGAGTEDIHFLFKSANAAQDGIDLTLTDGQSACLAVSQLPAAAAIKVGASGQTVSAPFDLTSLEPCP